MVDKLLHKIVSKINEKDERIIIGISGHGAAGKTTFAESLIQSLAQTEVNYINTDPFIIGSNLRNFAAIDYEYQNEKHRYKMTACHPLAHQTAALERDIHMLKEGMDFRTIATHYQDSALVSSQNKVSIVEGMTVAFVNPQLFDLKIYLYTDGETEFRRRRIRDVAERGVNIDFIKQSHHERRIQYELFMHEYSENFDVIIKNTIEEMIVEKMELR